MTFFAPEATGPPVVWVEYEGPGRQRRLTIAFRWILAIPHLLYGALVSIALFFAIIAGWFAALFLGRLPVGLAEFVGRGVQYLARIYAYGYLLLTDRYPPFDLGRPDYAVSVDLPAPVRLNRAAVLFRFILLIPAFIVVQVIGNGLYVVVFVAWLLALMMGRLPVPLFEAFAAILRYLVRFYAFAAMLTSEYPRGLFGDKEPARQAPAAPMPAEPTKAPETAPTTTDFALDLPPTPRLRTLILSRAAKWIIGLVLALGVVLGITFNAIGAFTDSETADRVEDAYLALDDDARRYASETQRCAVSGGIECLNQANRELAASLRTFQNELRDLEFTQVAIDEAEQVDEDVTALIDILEEMATTSNPAIYEQLLFEFQSLANRFDQDVNDLLDAARFS